MAAYLGQLVTDLRALLATNWSEVKANGIWEYRHINMVPWQDLTLPYAVMVFPEFTTDDRWGVTNDAYSGQVELYYVGEDLGEASTQITKMETVRTYLIQNGLTGALIPIVSDVTWNDDIEPNIIFRDKNYTSRASRLTVEIVVGETKP